MSDEVPPAPLRLKPRVKSDGENAAATPVDPATSVSEVSATTESPRFKLRPKLELTTPAADTTAEPVSVAATNPMPSSLGLKPRLVIAQSDTIPAPATVPSPPNEIPPPVATPPVQA